MNDLGASGGSKRKGNEVVTNNATLKCSKGSSTCLFKVPEGTRKIHGEVIAINEDVGKCIGSFGFCSLLQSNCVPHQVSFPWTLVADDFHYRGKPVVIEISVTFCPVGGIISIVHSGQKGENKVTDNADMELKETTDLFGLIMRHMKSGKYHEGGLGLLRGFVKQMQADFFKATLSGVQKTMKSSGDPINTSTGNFYYAKTDIKIDGKYPLEFKRFYNAIDGMDHVLGKGWTHNYNIKLIKENNETKILLGDGRVEKYDEDKHKHYNFNEDGDLLYIEDENQVAGASSNGKLRPAGNRTSLEYKDAQLIKVSSASGTLTFQYDQDGLIRKVHDDTKREVRYEYENGNLTKVYLPETPPYNSPIITYDYDEIGRIIKIKNPLEIESVQNEYDEENRTIKQIMADGGVLTLSYDDEKKTNTTIEPNNNKIIYHRDENYRTTKIEYEDFEENFEFDSAGNLTNHKDKNGNSHDFKYDDENNLIEATNPLGESTTIKYDEKARKPIECTGKKSGAEGGFAERKITEITSPNGAKTNLTYDKKGNITEIIAPLNRKTKYRYDFKGNVTELTLPDGSKKELEYDSRGNIISITANRVVTRYEYNKRNEVIKFINGNGNTTKFKYTAKGEILNIIDPLGSSCYYGRDMAGRIEDIVDFNNSVTSYKYNKMGKVIQITKKTGFAVQRTKIAYDLMGNITSVTDANKNTVYYEYDKYNRITKTIDQEGNETKYKHDNNGNILEVTDPNGSVTKIEYDSLNRKKKIIHQISAIDELNKLDDE
jgi:YD repeat-containing protein